jgi:hypothetical protein
MSIASQAHVNVLNGTVGSAFVDGRPAGDNGLIPSIPGNALLNPTFNVAESAPPTYNEFNGSLYFNKWGHYGQLYTSDGDFKTHGATRYLANFPAFKDLGGINLGDQPKVLKIFGAGTNFPSNTANVNTNNSRTYPNIPLTAFTDSAPAGAFPDSGAWTKNEWSQGVAIPDGATTVKFGAYIRTPADDLFRDLNCGGVYIWQDTSASPPSSVYVNAIVVKKPTDTINLVTGTQTLGINSQQQWSGLDDATSGFPSVYALRWNDSTTIQSIDYKSTADHQQFTKVEKEVTLQSGTGRRLGLGLFFGENQSNLDESATPTGSIHFYNPFIIFE